ncbi:inositol monophosphatase [Collibacillus ludicampi]|uniref:Inositol-1-monophosphatase n=1 Tax=Collibacillus ludicampi TaxID=2771369 RepID=A0AAV4LB88_9BACL|nr:inositol monophosphatase family protein [Collibacillus ludicampi]GIM45000.1 inositol monophosphatase [Collibacillus ludicampi]
MYRSFVQCAEEAARKAGALIKEKIGQASEIREKTSASDLVTEVDKASQEIIEKHVLSVFPQHTILGEEDVAPGAYASVEALEKARKAEYLWIIDPIDGTTNFIHAFPFCCVSIALAHRGEVIAGVVYDPVRDELFRAVRGEGATCNGKPLRVSAEDRLENALLAGGFAGEPEGARKTNLRGLMALVPHVRSIRTAGSAALHLAYVAAGRLSGFWEIDLNAWDLAAGCLLVQEAGGQVTDTAGNAYTLAVRHVLATNGRIHQDVLHILKESEATGFESS